MLDKGTYTEYPELGITRFEANNGSSLIIHCEYIDGQPMMTLEDTEKLAKWAINNGNELGYGLMEQLFKVRMKYKAKK